jgi:ribosome-binding factor A
MVRTSERSERLARVILPHMSTICMKFLSPDRHGFVTVTGLNISGDLGIAEVKLSVLGAAEEDAVDELIRKRKKISYEIAQLVPTRRSLAFRFLRDGAADALKRIESLDV